MHYLKQIWWVGCLFLIGACSAAANDPAGAVRSYAPEVADGFESVTLSGIWTTELAVASRLTMTTQSASEGKQALRLDVVAGETVNNGNRSEIVFKNSDPICQEGWYRWSVMIPADYNDADTAVKWQVIGQWHDQPDTSAGESWATYPAHTPVVSFAYKSDGGNPRIMLQYGIAPNFRIISETPIAKGVWHTIVSHLYFSRTTNGFAEVWIDGNSVSLNLSKGANMYNAAPVYLKLGMYRNKEASVDNYILFDDFRRGPSRGSVGF